MTPIIYYIKCFVNYLGLADEIFIKRFWYSLFGSESNIDSVLYILMTKAVNQILIQNTLYSDDKGSESNGCLEAVAKIFLQAENQTKISQLPKWSIINLTATFFQVMNILHF